MYEVVNAGTEDLREAAVSSVGAIVHDVDQARAFMGRYTEIRSQLELGELPLGISPPLANAVRAIDALRAAQVQNIMADPGLSTTFDHDRRMAASSYLVLGVHVQIVGAVLERQAPQQQS